ncbi:SseB family protein [Nesterenkonia sp. NBAIMH1]|uniref:SseB family protein n=1 Tax=Nesterenkonia sp. NBAIMH1 TaxID=2600320 RepID=UPI0011B3C55C|nr:SseB family protein [Nesterenkonia sp. NBAIMH1]
MSQETAAPQPDLKQALLTAADGETKTEELVDVVNAFLQSQVYLPTVEQASEDGTINPLMLQDTEENAVMPLFSSEDAIPAEYAERAPHTAVVTGVAILQSVDNAGVVIDPGADHQFPLSQEQMAAIRQQISEAAGDDAAE